MERAVLYIHGQGGNPEEAEHYVPLFPDCDVIGLNYSSLFSWEAEEEFFHLFDSICGRYKSVTVIANSIGAYFAMCALSEKNIEKAFFISPIVDLEKLITDMLSWENMSEAELQKKGTIETSSGQMLFWGYLCYVRKNPVHWTIPTHILYGSKDNLTSLQTISEFARQSGATLTVMDGGEHWFHTKEQMHFLDHWIESLK